MTLFVSGTYSVPSFECGIRAMAPTWPVLGLRIFPQYHRVRHEVTPEPILRRVRIRLPEEDGERMAVQLEPIGVTGPRVGLHVELSDVTGEEVDDRSDRGLFPVHIAVVAAGEAGAIHGDERSERAVETR